MNELISIVRQNLNWWLSSNPKCIPEEDLQKIEVNIISILQGADGWYSVEYKIDNIDDEYYDEPNVISSSADNICSVGKVIYYDIVLHYDKTGLCYL